jgi:hypothetical protein
MIQSLTVQLRGHSRRQASDAFACLLSERDRWTRITSAHDPPDESAAAMLALLPAKKGITALFFPIVGAVAQ